MKSNQDKKGFTLIELMIALALGLAVTAAAMGVMLSAIKTQREGAMRAELARDAQLLMDTFARDMAYVGSGVPRGFEANFTGDLLATGSFVTNSSTAQLNPFSNRQLRPAIRMANDTYIAFIGDLPYPNAELNGIGGLTMMVNGATSGNDIGIVSELSPCTPPTAAPGNYTCDTGDESFIRAVEPSTGVPCSSSNLAATTCPWGMNKWQQDQSGFVKLVFSATDGSWHRRRWNMTTVETTGTSGRALIALNTAQPTGTGGVLPAVSFVQTTAGGGMVAQLDRVFWDGQGFTCAGTPAVCTCSSAPCTVHRRQCWGWNLNNDQPNETGFPIAGGTINAAVRNGGTGIDSCDNDDGGPWEEIVSDVQEFTIRYFTPTGLPTTTLATPLNRAGLSNTRVVELEFMLRRSIPGDSNNRTMDQRMIKRFWLENAGGLVTWPDLVDNSLGGCNPDTNLPNECNPQ